MAIVLGAVICALAVVLYVALRSNFPGKREDHLPPGE
jgi:hypothetical protein